MNHKIGCYCSNAWTTPGAYQHFIPFRNKKRKLIMYLIGTSVSASLRGNFWEKDEPAYDTIARILRLATKYEVPEVRACAIAKLHELWPLPTSLETMDTRAFSPHRAGTCNIT